MVNAIKCAGLSADELSLAVFLQGALNRRKKSVYLDVENYLAYLSQPVSWRNLWELAAESKESFDGLVVYDPIPGDVSVNMAATVCAAENFLGVPRRLAGREEFSGLAVRFDTAEIKGTDVERQRAVWLRWREKLKRDCLVHQLTDKKEFRFALRDFAISHGAFTFFVRPEEDGDFLAEVLSWADKNIPVYGWTTNEIGFVRRLSLFGDYIVPSDWSYNHSFLGRKIFKSLKQPREAEEISPSGHVLAIVVSDGDNVQWLERDFAENGLFGQRLRRHRTYKMSWTAAPLLCRICPKVLENIYQKAEKDTFVCGVSGIGYTNCTTFPEKYLGKFARQTAEAMKYADMRVLTLLDHIAETKEGNAEKRIAYFARHKQIIGGIWELDPDRYESGRGKIYWANGKPFVSVGISLWHPSCDRAQVSREWLDGIADQINARPVSPDTEEGYTVLNVHPWSMDMDMLDYVVSRLSKQVEIVSAEELIRLVAKNVKHGTGGRR